MVQTRPRGPPFRIPSSQVGYGWGLGVGGRATFSSVQPQPQFSSVQALPVSHPGARCTSTDLVPYDTIPCHARAQTSSLRHDSTDFIPTIPCHEGWRGQLDTCLANLSEAPTPTPRPRHPSLRLCEQVDSCAQLKEECEQCKFVTFSPSSGANKVV